MGKDLANGTINLNGGTANFNFGGGTLKALASQTDWLNSSLINTNQQALSSVTATGTSTTSLAA